MTEQLERGDLVEPFGAAGRIASPFSYWMVVTPANRCREEVKKLCAWVESRSAQTRLAIGEVADTEGPNEGD